MIIIHIIYIHTTTINKNSEKHENKNQIKMKQQKIYWIKSAFENEMSGRRRKQKMYTHF